MELLFRTIPPMISTVFIGNSKIKQIDDKIWRFYKKLVPEFREKSVNKTVDGDVKKALCTGSMIYIECFDMIRRS